MARYFLFESGIFFLFYNENCCVWHLSLGGETGGSVWDESWREDWIGLVLLIWLNGGASRVPVEKKKKVKMGEWGFIWEPFKVRECHMWKR